MGQALQLSDEHSEHRWATAERRRLNFFSLDHWVYALIRRAEAFRQLMPVEP